MYELVLELFGETASVALRAVGTLAFTALGIFAELNAVHSLTTGEQMIGLWALYMGAIALYAGLVVFGGETLSQFRGDPADA